MKREPLKNEIRALWTVFKGWLYWRDFKREADRRAAGIIRHEEAEQIKETGKIPSWVYGQKEQVHHGRD